MSDSRMFTGGCHCGLVRFECTTDLAMVTACNCSICTKKGLHFTFLPPKSFQLRAGEDNLREYLFNKHAIRHQLCADCGVDVFSLCILMIRPQPISTHFPYTTLFRASPPRYRGRQAGRRRSTGT